MNKTAMLGGSFDPVHKGHLFLIHQTVTQTTYRKIILVPAFLSNFKQNSKPVAHADDRLKMLSLAVLDYRDLYPQDDVELQINTVELERGGVSYTSDTVKALYQNGLDGKLGLIVGDDHIDGLSKWHDYDYLKNSVQYVICRRFGSPSVFEKVPSDVDFVSVEPEITAVENSTGLRESRDTNLNFLSERVRDYVIRRNLYN